MGNDSHQWYTNINNYNKVTYQNLYSGIKCNLYGNQRQLEYDIEVAPYGDPKPIRLQIEGAKNISLDAQGNLLAQLTNDEKIFMHKPVIYQTIAGHKQFIKGQFVLFTKNIIGFQIDSHNKSYALIIDPVLIYSTYLAEVGAQIGSRAIAHDSHKSAYVAGSVNSLDFPVKNAFQATNIGKQRTIFITKMNSIGNDIFYSTYLGGSGNMNQAFGIAVDSNGYAYITGYTNSKDFPTQNAYQDTNKSPNLTAFITKLNPAGNSLTYSTYLGGTGGNDVGHSIAVDISGHAYRWGD